MHGHRRRDDSPRRAFARAVGGTVAASALFATALVAQAVTFSTPDRRRLAVEVAILLAVGGTVFVQVIVWFLRQVVFGGRAVDAMTRDTLARLHAGPGRAPLSARLGAARTPAGDDDRRVD